MKKIILSGLIVVSCYSSLAFSENSIRHASNASKHSILTVSHGVAGSAKVVSAVVAIPLVIAASTAEVSKISSQNLSSGESPQNRTQVLVLTDKVVTADPSPRNFLQKLKNEQNN